jgi:hypothetical protein
MTTEEHFEEIGQFKERCEKAKNVLDTFNTSPDINQEIFQLFFKDDINELKLLLTDVKDETISKTIIRTWGNNFEDKLNKIKDIVTVMQTSASAFKEAGEKFQELYENK